MELFRTSSLFQPTHECKRRTIIHQGGRRSTKSFTILQELLYRAIHQAGYIAIVNGWDMPHMKKGIIMDLLRLINTYPLLKNYVKSFNLSETKLTLKNNSFIQFTSFENEQDAKMTDINDCFMNECNLTKHGFGIYNQMSMQVKGQIFLDYNSMAPFWVHAKLLGREDVQLFLSDHRHNPFISEEQHRIIESQYPKDSELWKVYARGYTGRMEGSIYKNWQIVTEWPEDIEQVIWGIDYGYSVGMTALCKIGIRNYKHLILKGCCYKPGLTAEQIKLILDANGYISGQRFYSEHDETKIKELRGLGIPAWKAEKGEKSEWNGILKCQEFEVEYIYNVDLATELTSYQWESVSSMETGEDILTQSVKDTKKYHYMAAFRYAVFTHFNKKKGFTI
jgi:phage terminase large subunit